MLRRKKTNLRLTGSFEIVRRNKNGKVLKKAYSGDKLRRYEIRRQWGEPVVEYNQSKASIREENFHG